jgi:hypothetical protein
MSDRFFWIFSKLAMTLSDELISLRVELEGCRRMEK